MGNPTFVYVPRTANVLREREKHIALLEGELAAKDAWLEKAQADLAEFDREHRKLTEDLERSNQWAEELNQELAQRRACVAELQEELERSNQWAEDLNQKLAQRRARVAELQEELARDQENARRVAEGYAAKVAALEEEDREKTRWTEDLNQELAQRRARVSELQEELARDQENARRVAEGYAAKVAALEEENREKTRWALDTDTRLTAEIRTRTEHLARSVEELRRTEKELEERSAWARRLQEDVDRLEGLLAVFRASRWVKLGRQVGLGPAV
jgi:chromosome segregation ATPase